MLIGCGLANNANGMQTHSNISDYVRHAGMEIDGTWGSAIEMAYASHLFNVPLYV